MQLFFHEKQVLRINAKTDEKQRRAEPSKKARQGRAADLPNATAETPPSSPLD
jgi:hypothetical protein